MYLAMSEGVKDVRSENNIIGLQISLTNVQST